MKSIKSVPHRQRGMTTIGLVLVLATIGFFATLAIKLTPVYLESFQVTSIFKSVEKEVPMDTASDEDIRDSLYKHFDVNNINDINPKQVQIRRERGQVKALALKYHVRVPLFGNVDALVHFDKVVEVGH